MKRGKLIVISGPSGVGKGTIVKKFVDDPELKLSYSVSMTTRSMRPGEVNHVNYDFVTKDEFKAAIENDELLEYAEFVGNFYGTPLKNVNRLLDEGRNVLLEIEVQGCMQVQKKCPDALTIFITPPSMEELERRIRGRATEAEEIVQQRLSKALKEMELVNKYKYAICNDDVDLAAELVKTIIRYYSVH